MLLGEGTVLADRYRLDSRIGTGASAVVWRATDIVLDRVVALKLLHTHLREDPAVRERFRREAIAAGRLSHPNVVAVYDTVSTPDVEAIVLEYVGGRSLRAWLDDVTVLEPEIVRELLLHLLDGLGEAHRHGLIHRDIKPANILVAPDGRPKLADFGIARAIDDVGLTGTGLLIGTASYLSPEQVEGRPLDVRSDIYSLGVVGYELLVGEPPFSGESSAAVALARLRIDPEPPARRRPGVPTAISDVVMEALARDPAARLPDTAAFTAALRGRRDGPRGRDIAGGGTPALTDSTASMVLNSPPTAAHANAPVPVLPPRTSVPADRPSRFGVILLTTLLLGASALAAVLVWGNSSSGSGPPTSASAAPPAQIAGVSTFDPGGSGKAGENDELARNIIDGNVSTAWRTESYDARDFGTKSGVGIVIELDASVPLERIEIHSESTDWAASVYVGDDPTGFDPDRTAPAATADPASRDTTVELSGARGRAVLIWITRLGEGAPRYRVTINDVGVFARS